MNKQGHLRITKELLPQNMQPYRRWLLFGSILPDLLYHTYIVGHTWEGAFEKTIKGMKRLENYGGLNRLSCLYLGYLIHYVEDFFTLPHNKGFRGKFLDHVIYEKRFSQFLEAGYEETAFPAHRIILSVEDLKQNLEKLHEEYELGDSDFKKDTRYMKEALRQIFEYFAIVLYKNQCVLDTAAFEAFAASSQGFLLHGKGEV